MIGGPQVRNAATIGGNVGHALPAADGTISLLAAGAEVQLVSKDRCQWVELESIFAGPGKVTFDRSQTLISAFRIPLRGANEASAFYRYMRPQGVAIAIINMAAWVRTNSENKNIIEMRLAVGPAGPKPFRARKTETVFLGKKPQACHLQALSILAGEINLRTSKHRATRAYRHKLLPVLLKQVVERAYQDSLKA